MSPEKEANARIGDALVAIGACDQATIDDAVESAIQAGRRVGEVLVQTGKVSPDDVLHARLTLREEILVQRLQDLPAFDKVLTRPGGELGVRRVDNRFALVANSRDRMRRCFALVTDTGGADLAQAVKGAKVAAITGRFTVAGEISVKQEVLDLIYENAAKNGVAIPAAGDSSDSDVQKEFDAIASEAFRQGASDIHITIERGKAYIKLRIDGELEIFRDLTPEKAITLVRTAYNTLHEDGSTTGSFNPRDYQDAAIERIYPEGLIRFRYSGLPLAPAGNDVTLRVIPIGVEAKSRSLGEGGFLPEQEELLERIFANSSGLVLVCGTTGSGKSTTLATALEQLAVDRPGKKIRTLEDPVEYRIHGTYQTPAPRDGEFANALRQFLRADPDVIMVGEIRDAETAKVTIQAVRSGHLCVSTLHTEGALTCYERLDGMGVPRADLSSVGLIAGLIFQRLLPVLCPTCKVPATKALESADRKLSGILERARMVNDGTLDGIFVKHSGGCASCSGRGTIGREACVEIFRPTADMMEAVKSGNSVELWRRWRATIPADRPDDMTGRTAFEVAIWKMRQGRMSPVSVEHEFHFLDEKPWEGI